MLCSGAGRPRFRGKRHCRWNIWDGSQVRGSWVVGGLRVENAMSESPSRVGKVVVPEEHGSEVNLGKWDRWYKVLQVAHRGTMYGNATTYYMAAAFLTGCAAVEDWGCGTGGFKRFCPGEYIGPHLNRPWWWESHLRRLTERAKRQLPLFEEPNHDADSATEAEDPDPGP